MSCRKLQKHAEESSLPRAGVPAGQGPWVGLGGHWCAAEAQKWPLSSQQHL